MFEVAPDLSGRDQLRQRAHLRLSLFLVEPGHGGLEGRHVAVAQKSGRGELPLVADPGECQLVGSRSPQRLVKGHRGGDLGRTQAHLFEHEGHQRLEVLAGVALAGDASVLSAHGSLGLCCDGHEWRTGIEMTVAILVAHQAASTGRTLEHRQHVGPTRLRPAGGPTRAGGPDLGHRVPGRGVDDWWPVGGTAIA